MRYWLLAIGTIAIAFGFALMGLVKPDPVLSKSSNLARGRLGYAVHNGEYRTLGLTIFSSGVLLVVAGTVMRRR